MARPPRGTDLRVRRAAGFARSRVVLGRGARWLVSGPGANIGGKLTPDRSYSAGRFRQCSSARLINVPLAPVDWPGLFTENGGFAPCGLSAWFANAGWPTACMLAEHSSPGTSGGSPRWGRTPPELTLRPRPGSSRGGRVRPHSSHHLAPWLGSATSNGVRTFHKPRCTTSLVNCRMCACPLIPLGA